MIIKQEWIKYNKSSQTKKQLTKCQEMLINKDRKQERKGKKVNTE